jgi:RimJ/RimL family protein N-acetyltransferase
VIETSRLKLREWRSADIDPFAVMCADPRVMATLGALMTHDDSAALIDRMISLQARDGHCFWAVAARDTDELIGWCGLIRGSAPTIAGKLEIGWRLAHRHWGHGYAREAAQAALDWGFVNRADDSIWAITTPGNVRSWGLMERLGMIRNHALDFDHPNVPDGSPLKRHVTYCITRDVALRARTLAAVA